jgi:hypothetical protein
VDDVQAPELRVETHFRGSLLESRGAAVVEEVHRRARIDRGGHDVEPPVAVEVIRDRAARRIHDVEPRVHGDVPETGEGRRSERVRGEAKGGRNPFGILPRRHRGDAGEPSDRRVFRTFREIAQVGREGGAGRLAIAVHPFAASGTMQAAGPW